MNVAGEPSAATTGSGPQRRVAAFPDAKVETREEFKHSQLSSLESGLKMLYALLGLSVIVSLFGVVNTLVLSVVERTRELGMLRAIGMTRRQVRRMVRHESIVTALIGAALGVAVGMFLAAITTLALSDYGIQFALPYGSLVVFVGIAVVAGMLRRSCRPAARPGSTCWQRCSTSRPDRAYRKRPSGSARKRAPTAVLARLDGGRLRQT